MALLSEKVTNWVFFLWEVMPSLTFSHLGWACLFFNKSIFGKYKGLFTPNVK